MAHIKKRKGEAMSLFGNGSRNTLVVQTGIGQTGALGKYDIFVDQTLCFRYIDRYTAATTGVVDCI
ncbi:MAG TPA: hypothetical protein VNI77_05105 [Nitrososphaera sp.]|nr:hypothetical protein [Nitrososphaera sp.]